MAHISNDIRIITGDNEEIQTNKYLLSVFSPTLRPLLFTPCCTSPTRLLPDCSSSSIKHLLNIITIGFTAADEVIDINEVLETAKLLYVDIKELGCADNFNNTLEEEINSGEHRFDVMEVIETTTDKNNELNSGRNISVERGDVEAGSKTKTEQPKRRLKRKRNVDFRYFLYYRSVINTVSNFED